MDFGDWWSLVWILALPLPAAAAAKSLQSCPTLCDPIDSSPPGSSVPGTLQARILEWVVISCSNAWKWKVKVKSLSCAWLLATPRTGAYQAPPSIGFSRQEYWSGVSFPSPFPFLVRWYLLNYIIFLISFSSSVKWKLVQFYRVVDWLNTTIRVFNKLLPFM